MTRSYISFLLASLCLSTIILSVSAHRHEENKCIKRPDIQDCYDLPNKPTCAYYKENCPFDVCGYDQANWCYACNMSTTIYYKNDTCKESEVVSECYDSEVCNPDNDPQIQEAYEPVCGVQDGGKKKKTFDNMCASCDAKGYDWYQPGPCQKDRHKCKSSDRGKDCEKAKYAPVCAHLKALDNTTTYTTVSNGCNACADKAVDYYTEGRCGPLRDNVTYCLPNNRAKFCTLELNPVCAYYLNENGTIGHKIGGNPSCSCTEKDVIYHIPGPCNFTCDRRPNVIYECDGTLVDPICGTYEEDGKKVNVSLKNGCVGCYNIPIKIDYFVDGLCPGDEGIYCKNDASGFAQGMISPVCGVTKESCDEDSCRTSFTEPVFACTDNSTLLYKKGLCPGDEGFSCSPFREGVIEEDTAISWINYGEVCGYTELGCNDNSCRNSYTNQTLACADESVIFFKVGDCS